LKPCKISTPGQDTREDGHATADTPGTGHGGHTDSGHAHLQKPAQTETHTPTARWHHSMHEFVHIRHCPCQASTPGLCLLQTVRAKFLDALRCCRCDREIRAKNLCQKGGCRQRRGLPVAETARLPPPHHDLGRAVESCCSSKRRLCIRRQDCGHRRGDGEAVRRPRCRVIATHGSEAAHHTRHTGFRQHAPRAKGPSAHAWRLSLFSGPL
jgi:hypothetical protein